LDEKGLGEDVSCIYVQVSVEDARVCGSIGWGSAAREGKMDMRECDVNTQALAPEEDEHELV
jgi:hypothetical protein